MNKFLVIFGIIVLYGLLACDNSEQSEKPDSSPLQGTWSGNINGGDPHFEENATLTLELNQYFEQISGIISTSDGAFQDDTLRNGRFIDDSLHFEATQSELYPGAELSFSGQLKNDNFTGVWQHGRLHNGEWDVTRTLE